MSLSKRLLSVVTVSLLVSVGLIFPASVPAEAQEFGMTLPEPSGSPVGYRLYAVVDEAREEVFTEETGDVRSFPMAIYYPAAPAADAQPAPYSTDAENEAYNTTLMLPPVVFESMEAHLYVDAPLAEREGGYPVLIFSPGFGTPIRFYSALLSEVASQGFVVAIVDHPYSQSASIFPDGSVIMANAAGSDTASSNSVLDAWIADTQSALDTISELNEADPVLAGAFDLDHVGAFGHSYGGATAANVSLVDERVQASINMDGMVFGDAAQGVAKPFMMMTSEAVEYTDEDFAAVGMTREEAEAGLAALNDSITGALSASSAPYRLAITGTVHSTYVSDIALLRALLPEFITPEMVGAIDGARANEVIAAYTVAFFNTHLLGEASPLLDGASTDYPEVVFVTE